MNSSQIIPQVRAQYPQFATPDTFHLAYEEEEARTLIYAISVERIVLYDRVYHGPQNRAAQLMIVKAIEDLERAGMLALDDIMRQTDRELWSLLLSDEAPSRCRVLAALVSNGRRYEEKHAIRCAPAGEPEERELGQALIRRQQEGSLPDLEDRLAQAFRDSSGRRIQEGAVLIDVPEPVMKGEPILVVPNDPSGKPAKLAVGLGDLGESFRALVRQDEGRRIVKVYAPPGWAITARFIIGALKDLL